MVRAALVGLGSSAQAEVSVVGGRGTYKSSTAARCDFKSRGFAALDMEGKHDGSGELRMDDWWV